MVLCLPGTPPLISVPQSTKVSPVGTPRIQPKKVMPRKLRKSCTLDHCHREPGQCMHCTCDGRCGQHANGKCGVRREGSGKNCKRPDCTKDDKCFHSTRATCCHCRNLVSSQSRGAKRARKNAAMAQVFPEPKRFKIPPTLEDAATLSMTLSSAHSSPSYWPHKQVVHVDQLQPLLAAEEEVEEAIRSLWEYEAWYSRRQYCNIVVVVHEVVFPLHRFPILLQCPMLARAFAAVDVDCIELTTFPGGPEAFELAMIYAYTQHVQSWSARHVALLYGAAMELEMEWNSKFNLVNKALACVEDVEQYGKMEEVVDFVKEVQCIVESNPSPAMQTVLTRGITRLAKSYPYNREDLVLLQRLSCAGFLQVSQQVLLKQSSMDMLHLLCAQTQLAQVFQSNAEIEHKAKVLLRILQDIGQADSQTQESVQLALQAAATLEMEPLPFNVSNTDLARVAKSLVHAK